MRFASIARILIADDHPLFREALRNVCERVMPGARVVEVSTHAELLAETLDDERYDLVVVDLMMPGGDDLDALKALRRRVPATPTVVVSSREDAHTVKRAFAIGIAGFVPKSLSVPEMEDAIRVVVSGGHYAPRGSAAPAVANEAEHETLTPRQVAVLEHLSQGRSNRQIASDLGIEEITVKVHISAILRKLHVKNRLGAVLASQRLGPERFASLPKSSR